MTALEKNKSGHLYDSKVIYSFPVIWNKLSKLAVISYNFHYDNLKFSHENNKHLKF